MVHEIASFLERHEPFIELHPGQLATIAGAVEIEFFARGEAIFEQGQEPAERVRMVRSGAVELVDQGRPLDLLGPGELFGHPSMLAGLPTGFAARAHEDTICYRFPTEVLLPLLTRPAGLRFIARSLLARPWRPEIAPERSAADPARRRVGAFLREHVVKVEPMATVRETARAMAAAGASCALIELPDGAFGILTDQDLRVRVVGGDIPLDAAVEHAMTAPAFTVGPTRLGIDVMIEMINRGIRHVPVVADRSEVLGVVTDVDLLASETRTPFVVRRAIARAGDEHELVAAAQQLPPTVIALHDADVASAHVCGIIAAVADALTRRAIEMLADDLPPLTWYATGSLGRREAFPSSDVDSALAWQGDADPEAMRAFAGRVLELLARCGFPTDPHAASAAHPLFARSTSAWAQAVERWLDRPEDARLLVVLSAIHDARPVVTDPGVTPPFDPVTRAHEHPALIRQMRRLALSHRPPTGFLRDIVVEHSGEHQGRLDIKQGGLLPVVDLARYFAFAAGSLERSTPARLRAAAEKGIVGTADATTLEEAFELFTDLRMQHQVEQLRNGETPDDFILPSALNPLMRRYLREAFRSVSRMQRRLGLRAP